MLRFYVVPRRVWEEPIDFGIMLPRYNIFHPGIGSHGIHLDDQGEWLLLSTDFASERLEDLWHSHPEVARLPHPTQEGDVKLAHLHVKPQHARKQFKAHHWEKLAGKFGLDETHTVWDLHDRASAMDRDCRLSNTY